MVSIELHVKRVNRVSVQHGLPNQALKFVPASTGRPSLGAA